MIKIPVDNLPSQQFDMQLEESLWTFRIDYNSRQDFFYLGLDKDGEAVCEGIKLTSGVDLMRAFNFMTGALAVITYDGLGKSPSMNDWGTVSDFFYLSPEEITEIEDIQNG